MNILDAAKYFIQKSHEEGQEINHAKLQILCYYAEAYSLAVEGKPLFENEEFEAWSEEKFNECLSSN